MKHEKAIIAIVGILSILLIVFVLFSSDEGISVPSDKFITSSDGTADSQVVQDGCGDFQSYTELETLKKLKQNIKAANEGAKKTYANFCSPCHGKDGRGIIAPSISGKIKPEILKSLQDYKANLVPNTLMKGFFDNINDKELEALAEEISKLK